MTRLDNNKLIEYLKCYNSKKLYAKAGFVLERFKNSLGIEEKTIQECKKNISNTHYYFDDETKRIDNKFISDWNLIVPQLYLTRGTTMYWQKIMKSIKGGAAINAAVLDFPRLSVDIDLDLTENFNKND